VNPSNKGDREKQPALVPVQLDKQVGESLWQVHKAERGVWSEKMLRTLVRGVKGGKWFSLIDKVYADRTLSLAWEKVQSNAGACGVDGITVNRFDKDSEARLLAVKEYLKGGTYQPKSVKRVRIPKAGSKETRPLGIPTVTDRVVQQAVRMVLEPIYEHRFAEHSYRFRPGRSCHDALGRVDGQLAEGYTHVVDIDVQGYLDTINQERLMELLKEAVSDGCLLTIIEGFLKAGVLEDGVWEMSEAGTPQGGVISPLLSNLYLNELDHLMEAKGYAMTRYADDMVILCKSAHEAQCALGLVSEWMAQASLSLHPEKTHTVDMREANACFDFLGYRFKRTRSGRLMRLVRPKSKQKLRESIRRETRRCNKHSMTEIIERINPKLRGWFGYFKQAARSEQQGLDGWIRMRLRSIYRKRHRKCGRGRRSDHHRWPNRHFAELGLFSLVTAQREAISLRKGVKIMH
jgi:RNA-directed DNA polymerase